VLDATHFGVAQRRTRSFTIASRVGLPQVQPTRAGGPRTVRQAWGGLSARPDGRNNHAAPVPSALALARIRCIPSGGDKRDILRRRPSLAPPSWWRTRSDATDVWGRMEWDEPSNTLRTCLYNPSKGRYIHPEQHRVISMREAARLQSVPDSFRFVGLHTQVSRQIGNGVPPLLGRAVARAVMKVLR
jgi:DNA (cytosine-5)-methyltransferase 1